MSLSTKRARPLLLVWLALLLAVAGAALLVHARFHRVLVVYPHAEAAARIDAIAAGMDDAWRGQALRVRHHQVLLPDATPGAACPGALKAATAMQVDTVVVLDDVPASCTEALRRLGAPVHAFRTRPVAQPAQNPGASPALSRAASTAQQGLADLLRHLLDATPTPDDAVEVIHVFSDGSAEAAARLAGLQARLATVSLRWELAPALAWPAVSGEIAAAAGAMPRAPGRRQVALMLMTGRTWNDGTGPRTRAQVLDLLSATRQHWIVSDALEDVRVGADFAVHLEPHSVGLALADALAPRLGIDGLQTHGAGAMQGPQMGFAARASALAAFPNLPPVYGRLARLQGLLVEEPARPQP